MKNAYTLSTRTIRKMRGLSNPVVVKEILQTTILYKGVYYADVPEGEDADSLVQRLNCAEEEAVKFRSQFTDEEWMRYLDDGVAG